MSRLFISAPNALRTAPRDEIEVKVYSNQKQVSLYVNGEKLEEQAGEHIFKFRVKLDRRDRRFRPWQGIASTMRYSARSSTPNPAYKLGKAKSSSANWV